MSAKQIHKALFVLSIIYIIATAIWSLFIFDVANYAPKIRNQNATFIGIITEDPDVRLANQKLTIKPLGQAQGVAMRLQDEELKGNILVTASLYPEYEYGEKLEITCKLQIPEPIEDFRYDLYLAKEDIYSLCYYPKITKIDTGQGNPVKKLIFKLKAVFVKRVNLLFPEPHGSLLAGLLVGARKTIPRGLLGAFQIIGLTHIIAISGYNISVIANLLMRFGPYINFTRKKMSIFVALFIIFLVVLTGAEASVVRAGVMAFISILAFWVNRKVNILWLLTLSATVMLLQNPKLLIYDVGFQLSFLATFGLVYITPYFEKYLAQIFEWGHMKALAGTLKETLTTTLAATVVTTPLILYQFGRFSAVALIANILVLWVIPLIMLLGFVAVLVSLIWFEAGLAIGITASMGLEYIIRTTLILSNIPYASITMTFFPLWLMLASYGAMYSFFKRKGI